jgi:hypothetical protein
MDFIKRHSGEILASTPFFFVGSRLDRWNGWLEKELRPEPGVSVTQAEEITL